MQEDLKKNFILLSQVAKEKKYAQEYLGLLARRGDIGSIRIGKRWYTTWQWFEEFLESGQKKKIETVVVPEKQEIKLEKVEPVIVSQELKKEIVKIKLPTPAPKKVEAIIFPVEEKVAVAAETNEEIPIAAGNNSSPVMIRSIQASKPNSDQRDQNAIAINLIKTRQAEQKRTMPVMPRMHYPAALRNVRGPIRQNIQPVKREEIRMAPVRKNSVEERNRNAVPYPEIKLRKKSGVYSPGLVEKEKGGAPLFTKFAFALSFAIILLLLVASAYFVFSGGLMTKGMVAGATDERITEPSGIKYGGQYILTSAGDKLRESVSISRVVVQVAKENSISN